MSSRAARSFVKSADTSTAVASSKAALEKLLRRYGATGFSVAHDYAAARVVVSLVLPDTPGSHAPAVPVTLPLSIHRVYDALYGAPAKGEGYGVARIQQAERVAWRNLVLWVDAALSSAAVGLQTITESFFAHAIAGERGERMIDLVSRASLGEGVTRLLTTGGH